jgi:endonuclease/exonuclease/phosphatase family metal-dependent hydrolase
MSELQLAWWNTKLKPYRQPEPGDDQVARAASAVHALWLRGCRIIALGEVSAKALAQLERSLEGRTGTRWASAASERRGLGVLFEPDVVLVAPVRHLSLSGSQGTTAAWELEVRPTGGRHRLSVFCVHWPTNQFEGSARRDDCARMLASHLEAQDYRTEVIVLGDFNCEPFETELTRVLGANRDRELVLEGVAPLFNPFWSPSTVGDPAGPSWGTLKLGAHDPWQMSRWKLVDFGVVSADFVQPGHSSGWQFLEALVVKEGEMTSDHWPVILRVTQGSAAERRKEGVRDDLR